jgi:hypothetical protein
LYRAARPIDQFLSIFYDIHRHRKIRHGRLAGFARVAQRRAASGRKFSAIRVVDFEIQHILVDQCEKALLRIKPHSAEHSLCDHIAKIMQLLLYVFNELRGDGHIFAI